MSIVVDTNIIIAAMLRDGACRRRLFTDTEFLAPPYLLIELEAHAEELLEKAHVPREEYYQLQGIILSKIRLLRYEDIQEFIPLAERILRDIDPADSPFIACALATGSYLWSNDAALKRQTAVRVVTTKEMMREFSRK